MLMVTVEKECAFSGILKHSKLMIRKDEMGCCRCLRRFFGRGWRVINSFWGWRGVSRPLLLAELPGQIKADEQAAGLIRVRLIQKGGPGARPLRHGGRGRGRETDRKRMTPDFLLNAEGVCRSMDSQRPAVNQCRNDFRHQRHRGPDIESAAYAR